MGFRFLGIMVAYVVIAVAIYQFWPQGKLATAPTPVAEAENTVTEPAKVADAVDTPPDQSVPSETMSLLKDDEEPFTKSIGGSTKSTNVDSTGDVSADMPTAAEISVPAAVPEPTKPAPVVQRQAAEIGAKQEKVRQAQDRIISSSDRMEVLRTWTMIEECRLNKCGELDFSDVTLSWLPEEVRDLKRVSSIILGRNMSDVTALTDTKNIRTIIAADSLLSDIGPLETLTGLKTLELQDSRLSDLTPIAGLAAMEHLSVANTQVFDLAPIRELYGLEFLDISSTRIADLEPITELYQLKSILLNESGVMDLSFLTRLSGLERIEAANTQLRILPNLAVNTQLAHLDISSTEISDLTPIRDLRNLTYLNLQGTQVQDLSALAKMTKLRTLDLRGTLIKDLTVLGQLDGLEEVFLTNISTNAVGTVAELESRGVVVK